MPSNDLSRGNILNAFLIGPTLTPAAVAVSTSAEQTFTVQGLNPGDEIGSINPATTQTAGIIITNGRVPAANTLIIQFANCSAASATPVSAVYSIEINRPTVGNSALPTSGV